jgi:hypothetical protein
MSVSIISNVPFFILKERRRGVLVGIAGCCATFGADAAGVVFEVVAALGAKAFVERPGDGGEQYEGQRGGGQDPAADDGILPQKDCRTPERDRWIPGLKQRKRGTQTGGTKRRTFNRAAYRGPWIEKPTAQGMSFVPQGMSLGGIEIGGVWPYNCPSDVD